MEWQVYVAGFGLALALLYWLCSFAILVLRARLPVLQSITQYGGRVVRAATKRDEDDVDEGKQSRRGTIRSVPAVARWGKQLLSEAERVLQRIQTSFLGTTRLSRQHGFCAFYVVGILTCIVLFLFNPTLQCCEVAAEQSVRSYLGIPQPGGPGGSKPSSVLTSLNAFKRTTKAGRVVDNTGSGRRPSIRQRMHALRGHADVLHSTFLDVTNITLAKTAVRMYDVEVQQCVDMLGPLRHLESLPLIAFGIHCVVRLSECLLVHRYRRQGDTITLFALIAGCTFYWFAAWSSQLGLFQTWRESTASRSLASNGLLITAEAQRRQVSPERLSAFVQNRTEILKKKGYQRTDMRIYPRGLLAGFDQVVIFTHPLIPQLIVCLLFVLHLCCQVVQAVHHDALAALRRRAPNAQELASIASVESRMKQQCRLELLVRSAATTAADGAATTTMTHRDRRPRLHSPEPMRTDTSTSGSGALYDSRVLRYHFPDTLLFRYVLEPHYSCEIIMYALNCGMLFTLLWFGGFFVPGAMNTEDVLLLPFYDRDSGALGWPGCLTVLLHVAVACGVMLFSAVNLGMTAMEHRDFWEYVESERDALQLILPAFKVPQEKMEEREKNADLEWRVANMYGGSSKVESLKSVPHYEVALRKEIIPQWNFVPYAW